MKKTSKMVSTILAFMLIFANTSLIFANDAVNIEDININEEARKAYIEEKMIELGSTGAEEVDKWLALNGIVQADKMMDGVETITPMSAPGSVKLQNIQAYYDTSAKKYLIKGWWNWQGTSLTDSIAGAVDGVSLAMCQTNWNPVTGYVFDSNPTGIAVYDYYGTHYPYAGSSSKIDKSGILYTFQDSGSNASYCGYSGQVWAWLKTIPTQLPFYLKMDYQHTWSSASLSSFGFNWPTNSAPSINMTFNLVPSNFTTANQTTISNWPNN